MSARISQLWSQWVEFDTAAALSWHSCWFVHLHAPVTNTFHSALGELNYKKFAGRTRWSRRPPARIDTAALIRVSEKWDSTPTLARWQFWFCFIGHAGLEQLHPSDPSSAKKLRPQLSESLLTHLRCRRNDRSHLSERIAIRAHCK